MSTSDCCRVWFTCPEVYTVVPFPGRGTGSFQTEKGRGENPLPGTAWECTGLGGVVAIPTVQWWLRCCLWGTALLYTSRIFLCPDIWCLLRLFASCKINSYYKYKLAMLILLQELLHCCIINTNCRSNWLLFTRFWEWKSPPLPRPWREKTTTTTTTLCTYLWVVSVLCRGYSCDYMLGGELSRGSGGCNLVPRPFARVWERD